MSMSRAMTIYCSLNCEIASELNETTFKRNVGEFAGYEETVIHVILHGETGQPVSIWQTDKGKSLDEAMLDRMVEDKLLVRRKPTQRSPWSSPVWIKVF